MPAVLSLIALLVLALGFQTPAALISSDTMPLSMPEHGIDGELQVMQDARLTAARKEALWGKGLGGDEDTLRHAKLRVVRLDGTVVDSVELDRPLARLEKKRLYGDGNRRETFLVTVDYSAGLGSYNGPITSFVEVVAGRLKWLEALDSNSTSKTAKASRMTVMTSLKTVWQFAPAAGGSGQDILEARCRPEITSQKPGAANADARNFTISYYRYTFNGKQWIRRVREVKGYSDFEDGFPARRLFPK